jgi:hypothetical protein
MKELRAKNLAFGHTSPYSVHRLLEAARHPMYIVYVSFRGCSSAIPEDATSIGRRVQGPNAASRKTDLQPPGGNPQARQPEQVGFQVVKNDWFPQRSRCGACARTPSA